MDIGLSTERIDRLCVTTAVSEAYKEAWLDIPRIIWCKSPLEVAQKVSKSTVWRNVEDRIRTNPMNRALSELSESMSSDVLLEIFISFQKSPLENVESSIGFAVESELRSALDAPYKEIANARIGQYDASRCAIVDYCSDVLGFKHGVGELFNLMELVQNVGWCVTHDDTCWVSDRPVQIYRDVEGRVHNEYGAAIAYPDGWSIFAINGIRVPRYVVERPSEISVDRIDDESNVEVRRVMLEKFGIERYVRDSGATLVSSCPNDHPLIGLRTAKLYRKEFADDEALIMLDMKNSTAEPDGTYRRYMIRIDPSAYGGMASKNCLAAMASTYRGKNGRMLFKHPEDYAPIAET